MIRAKPCQESASRFSCEPETRRSHVQTYSDVPKICPDADLINLDWQKFKRLLESKTFAAHDTKRVRGDALTAAWAEESGFRDPVIATDKTGMGIKVREDGHDLAVDAALLPAVSKSIGTNMFTGVDGNS